MWKVMTHRQCPTFPILLGKRYYYHHIYMYHLLTIIEMENGTLMNVQLDNQLKVCL